ncbi:hypothetical protein ARMGADRAFT_1111182, partial [Armillaria gallica]
MTILCSRIDNLQSVVDIKDITVREFRKLEVIIQVPFRAGNQFLGEGRLQDIYYGIHDKLHINRDQHVNLGRTIDSSIVQ